ncbi:2-phospho-L-lactate transferase [bacterium HR25]|jgi:LPPG:FO 2-phospho-L-lactate transferase|nr:2-phospho-L-lactate transferase [bacterium HR25]
MITVLAGGTGAARFLQGLVQVVPPREVTIVSNVGDDAEMYGLHVSPDIDNVVYHLAGIADEPQGWGIRGDTFQVVDSLARFGYETWFRLGDRDLATCLHRTRLLREGLPLSRITAQIAAAFGLECQIVPVTDDPVRTKLQTSEGLLDFQEYFARYRAEVPLQGVLYQGAEASRPAPRVLEAIARARAIIVAPSNPVLSIGPILAVRGIRQALRDTPAKVAAVSPIVGGGTLKGPADRVLRELGHEVSPVGVARLYADFLDVMVLDERDAGLRPQVEALGLEAVVTDTIMSSPERKAALARRVLEALGVSS